MEKAAESASLTAAQKQKAYGDYFNKRSSVKNFNIGEQVVLLIPDSSNKIYARWTGPGEIIQHHPPHSYKVKLSNGTVRHVHMNKIRKYHPRALAVGVIFEGDHEFEENHPSPIYRAKVGTHRIRLKPNIERKKPFVYRVPESLKIKVDEQIEELLRLDLIEESDTEIAYPIVCVNKKDGTLRLCVDFGALNSESVSDDFPMKDAVELIHSIGRANIITTLDLLKGYWAIPMAEDSKNLTSFKTHRQQYHFKVMSFGLKNASATFKREMNKALSCYREFSRAYIDDIAIFSKNWEEHLHLDTILTKLSELNFTVNLKKCAFGKAQIKYLGHIIGSGKHEPDPEKTAVINNLSVPTTKKELRSVLRLCNYYLEAPSLYSPVPDKPYTIHSDASQIGIAACLSQKCGDKCYPIAYVSQKLSKTQKSWSTIEREAFAIVWSLKKFEVWVFGTESEFYTDHNPLPYLTKCAPQSARLQRWAFALQKFNVTIKHCPGGEDAERFRCRKNYFALNVQTIVDSDLVIRNVVARWPGSAHDSTVFNNSAACLVLKTNALYQDFHLLGDTGYACEKYLLTPFGNPRSLSEARYNKSYVLTRNTIERKYGILKRRFPCLSIGLNCHIDRVPAIVVACCVLHNLCMRLEDPEPPADPQIEALVRQLELENEDATLSFETRPRCPAGFAKRNVIVTNFFSI
ncbi:retrovirus-related Pol polyprotein from transposon 17.6 [Trichonephila clavipes]|nr:retrovirus-related Pol polyprotein from transposon 17.6 [Trichonephila clavipes]